MKKIAAIILTICFALSSVISFAQDKAFAPKTNSVSAGIGFGYTSNYVSGTTSTPVFTGIYEYGFKQAGPGVLGLGGLISFQNSNYEFVSNQGNFEES